MAHDALERRLELRSLEAEQTRHDENAAIAILNIRRMDDGMHQQALRIDKDVALLAFDFP